jgi:hypothetical protein
MILVVLSWFVLSLYVKFAALILNNGSKSIFLMLSFNGECSLVPSTKNRPPGSLLALVGGVAPGSFKG